MFDEVVYLVDTCETTLKHPDFALKLDRAVQAIVAESFSIQYVLSRPDPKLMPFSVRVWTGEVRPVFTQEHVTDTSTLFDAIVALPGRYSELWESPRARHILIIHTAGDRPASQASMMDALKALDTLALMGVSIYFAHAEVHELVPGGVFRPTPEPVVNGDLMAEVVPGGVSIRNTASTVDYGAIWRYLSVEQRATMLDIEEDGKLLWENLELAQSLESLGLLVYEEESNLYWISETGKRLMKFVRALDAESVLPITHDNFAALKEHWDALTKKDQGLLLYVGDNDPVVGENYAQQQDYSPEALLVSDERGQFKLTPLGLETYKWAKSLDANSEAS